MVNFETFFFVIELYIIPYILEPARAAPYGILEGFLIFLPIHVLPNQLIKILNRPSLSLETLFLSHALPVHFISLMHVNLHWHQLCGTLRACEQF